jgi:hypothetical protein
MVRARGGSEGSPLPLVHDDPETRRLATRYITRKGYADILPALGLDAEEELPVMTSADCEICGNRLPFTGVCRRRMECRELARAQGDSQ